MASNKIIWIHFQHMFPNLQPVVYYYYIIFYYMFRIFRGVGCILLRYNIK
jgi:hypothetical protein